MPMPLYQRIIAAIFLVGLFAFDVILVNERGRIRAENATLKTQVSQHEQFINDLAHKLYATERLLEECRRDQGVSLPRTSFHQTAARKRQT